MRHHIPHAGYYCPELNLTTDSPKTLHHVIQATASEGLAQGPYVVARVGFKPATLRTEGTELNTEPPRLTWIHL